MKFRGWLALAAFSFALLLAGCSRADPSIIAAAPAGEDQNAGQGTQEIAVAADETALAYQQTELTGPADTQFSVNFTNPAALEHNWVLVEEGQADSVAAAAAANQGDPTGIPGVITGGKPIASSSEIIPVPARPAGQYTYLCTVPGHYAAGMHGTLTLGQETAAGSDAAPATSAPAEGSESAAPAPAGGGTSSEVSADPTLLVYQETTLTIPAGQPTTITFNNPAALEHNFVVVEPGQEDAVAAAAVAQNGDPRGIDGVLASGPPIASGSEPIEIPALDPGTYPYICTVPGHYAAGMHGTLTVQ